MTMYCMVHAWICVCIQFKFEQHAHALSLEFIANTSTAVLKYSIFETQVEYSSTESTVSRLLEYSTTVTQILHSLNFNSPWYWYYRSLQLFTWYDRVRLFTWYDTIIHFIRSLHTMVHFSVRSQNQHRSLHMMIHFSVRSQNQQSTAEINNSDGATDRNTPKSCNPPKSWVLQEFLTSLYDWLPTSDQTLALTKAGDLSLDAGRGRIERPTNICKKLL
jgi:hypothetical protein